jgi:hypothetical protein
MRKIYEAQRDIIWLELLELLLHNSNNAIGNMFRFIALSSNQHKHKFDNKLKLQTG